MNTHLKPILLALALTTGLPVVHVQAQDVKVASPAAVKVTQQEVAPAVYELAYSARQNAVFVMAPTPFEGELKNVTKPQVIRLNGTTLAREGATVLPDGGFGCVLDDANHMLYIGTHDGGVIAFDTDTNKVTGQIQLAEKVKDEKSGAMRPAYFLRQLWLDSKNQRIYVPGLSNRGSVLFVIDARTFRLIKTVAGTGMLSTGITQAPGGGDIYLTNRGHQLITIDSKTLEIKSRITIAVDQPLFLDYNARRNEIVTVDSGSAMVYTWLTKHAEQEGKTYRATSQGNALVALDPQTGKTLRTIPAGKQPVAVRVDDKAGRIYVTGRAGETVSIYSSSDYRLLNTVNVHAAPNSIAINPADGSAYISVKHGINEKEGQGGQEKVIKLQF
ncbi:hypothetical protein OCJ35_19695 [Pluralibacter gergoviae]|uniref:YncE family protein n=1 Tax=Pluralibacter gergoviae TaxID=61647 RepID=UPI000BFD8D1D|nr:DUF5074 domain-containing protein [Pluralibacter gergoviae]MCK1066878.1 hypothetical protein [Pluralibacter gergoviae]MCV7760311.1 hypothetical protein [Pluralibacter gergoviae]PHH45478.1 hypothetical protein CRX51_06745 [Pluralibacter gergoviae]HDS1236483.1 hypothetical protein [Pluralibacter gergoviae]HDS1242660.1 hypothetical protein [Pluralibacter gergoviae]